MTTPSTGDARAEERVVEAVTAAILKANKESKGLTFSDLITDFAVAAIEAYRKAMRDD